MTPSRALVGIPVAASNMPQRVLCLGLRPKSTTPPNELGGVVFTVGTAPQRGLPEGHQTRKEIYLPVPSGVKHGWIEPAPAATNIRRTKMAIKRVSVRRTTKTVKVPVKVTVRRTIKVTRTR